MSNISLSLLTSCFFIIPAITSLPPLSADFSLSGRSPQTLPIAPPALLVLLHLASLQLKEEGDLHRERRGRSAA